MRTESAEVFTDVETQPQPDVKDKAFAVSEVELLGSQ